MKVNTEYSKQEAALQMLQDAILLDQKGHYASAITLCGAVEGMLPNGLGAAFSNMQAASREEESFLDQNGKPDEKKIISAMNEHRDWLKHFNRGQPERLDLFDLYAAYFLFRAASKYWDAYDIPNNISIGSPLVGEYLVNAPDMISKRRMKYEAQLALRA